MNKRNYFKSLCLGVAFAAVAMAGNAQEIEHSVLLHGTLPTGQFNDVVHFDKVGTPQFLPMDRQDIGKEASAGLGASYRAGFIFDTGIGDIEPFAELGFMWNRVSRDTRDAYDGSSKAAVTCKKPNYFNVPLYLGLKYRYPLTDMIRPFIEGGVGFDLFFISASGWKDAKPYYRYNARGAMAWQIGLGTYLGEWVSVSMHYQGLGKHVIKYNDKSTISDRDLAIDPQGNAYYLDYSESRSLGLLALSIGFHF